MGTPEVIKALVDPINKLIEVCSKGIGQERESARTKKNTDAEAYKIRTIGMATTETAIQQKELEIAFMDKIQNRNDFIEAKRQINIDSVIDVAHNLLSQQPPITNEPLNEDWITRFFNIAQDISDAEMKILWGRILAGEIKQPKSFSLRTLEVLKNLSKDEAEIFEKVAQLGIVESDSCWIFTRSELTLRNAFKKYNIEFNEYRLLIELGILNSDTTLTNTLPSDNVEEFKISLMFGKDKYSLIQPPKNPSITLRLICFTKIGTEMLNLIGIYTPEDYLKDIIFYFTSLGAIIIKDDN